MKSRAVKQFRKKLATGEALLGVWATLESATVTEIAAALGFDWVVVDAEHGHLDWKEINEHVRAGMRSDTVVLVRISERSTSLTKRALDIGADGVVIPWIESAQQLREAVVDCRYPPAGRRGIGGERATAWGECFAEHVQESDQNVLIVPLIESETSLSDIPGMGEVDGVDIFFFGPADLSATAGFPGRWEGPGVAETILQARNKIEAAGKFSGIMTTSYDDLHQRREQGFQMLGLGTDTGLLLRSLHQGLAQLGRDRRLAPSLDAAESWPIPQPLFERPLSMKPDRPEQIIEPVNGQHTELQAGVSLTVQVGEFNRARGLTTGIAVFKPGAALDWHTHPCSESITVLEGELEVAAEGRIYRLSPLDNITIPRWLPHRATNRSVLREARVHIALAMSTPERTLMTREFETETVGADSQGLSGSERITRFPTAPLNFKVGPGTEFIDYFNADLIPGLEMSGGFCRFHTGGRLPTHLHDFDESICIIKGNAACFVEGRFYALSNSATAMVPRGRIHYFRNESESTMEMIWVYAGPRPERILIDECFSTAEPQTRELSM